MLEHFEAYKPWEYIDRRIHLLRATFFNTIPIALIGCIRYWLYWKIWLSLFILGIAAFLTWRKARCDSDNDLAQLYKLATKDDEAKK